MSDLGRLIADRYRLVERVGRGGMGTVWRAEDELLGRHVAVKKLFVPPQLDDDEIQTLHERTRREARTAARITHPHVIVVHDVVDDEGLPCIVMEYIPSDTLGDIVKRHGALTPDRAARIGCGMAAALRAAHDAGVLHRDVKPANVLLGNDGRIVLTDFGIAVQSGTPSLTRTGELVGSIQYLAPERLRSTIGEPGPASDLWSLGATLYQAVEGRPPFLRDTAIETAYAIAAEEYEAPRNAGDLAPVIESLLRKDPGQRMDAHEAEHLLGQAAGATPPGQRPLGDTSGTRAALDAPSTRPHPVVATGDPAQGGKGKRRTVLRFTVAVAVAASVTGGALLWPWGGADASGSRPSGTASAGRPTDTDPYPLPPPPAGYHLAKEDQGYSLPVRDGWKRGDPPGGEIAYVAPSKLAGLRINVVEFAGGDPLRHWRETEEAQTRRDNPGYERVRMDSTTFRERPAGYWEFTFDGRERKFRAVELAFSGADGTQYVIYLSAPDAQWNTYRPMFDTAVKGFRFDA
ncbi:serine/threonine-protein kinase [Streptomyces sp. NPDC015125]|uniref:serine/threonine-protein kinase n=1 Tax=Streptomyces sp. NPDC015125 TaxID=3364938 RepID=UPI00370363A5